MKKNKLILTLVMLSIILTSNVNEVYANAKIDTKEFVYKEILDDRNDYDLFALFHRLYIYEYYDNYQGENVYIDTSEVIDGAIHYYRGYLQYDGRSGGVGPIGWGIYRYKGAKGALLYKVVMPDGSVVYPTSHNHEIK